MKKFMDRDFLLNSKASKKLYHDYASKMPIIDYHCHLSPKEIAEDKHFSDITEIWLGGDHYKWRAMRGCGVEEKYITGDATPKEKFMKWAESVPYIVGNPLYHWTHLELQRYFDIDEPLCPASAERIWNKCNELLARPDFGAQGFIKRSGVEIICTTDDPCDDLAYHKQIAENKDFDVQVLPTFRPDNALNITKPGFADYIKRLSDVTGSEVSDFEALKKALDARLDFFVENGCRVSDHDLNVMAFSEPDDAAADEAFKAALRGEELSFEQVVAYRSTLLIHFAENYYEKNISMQFHMGVYRNTNTAMFDKVGVDTGFDAIRDEQVIEPLTRILDALEKKDKLAKTVLYSLNPCNNEALIALATTFNGHGIAGKIQLGSAWWLNDQLDGMLRQLTAFASVSVLSKFIGMLTDSRSFLSYTRHEYFRRIVCELIGDWVDKGLVPNDMEMLGKIVCDISYNNTKNYFFN